MAFLTKTLDLVFAVGEHSDDQKVRINRYAQNFYRTNIKKLTKVVNVFSDKVVSVQQTTYSYRNVPHTAYIVRFTLSVEAPATDIASRAIESVFPIVPNRGQIEIPDYYVLLDRKVV